MNTAEITEKQEVVCEIVTEMSQVILFLLRSITGNTYNIGGDKAGYDANKVGKNETEVFVPLFGEL